MRRSSGCIGGFHPVASLHLQSGTKPSASRTCWAKAHWPSSGQDQNSPLILDINAARRASRAPKHTANLTLPPCVSHGCQKAWKPSILVSFSEMKIALRTGRKFSRGEPKKEKNQSKRKGRRGSCQAVGGRPARLQARFLENWTLPSSQGPGATLRGERRCGTHWRARDQVRV